MQRSCLGLEAKTTVQNKVRYENCMDSHNADKGQLKTPV